MSWIMSMLWLIAFVIMFLVGLAVYWKSTFSADQNVSDEEDVEDEET